MLSSYSSTMTETNDLYTLSLHDALPISFPKPIFPRYSVKCSAFSGAAVLSSLLFMWASKFCARRTCGGIKSRWRSEEHTSELQSHSELVCRLLLEKKKMRASCV